MGRGVAHATLRLWAPQGSEVQFVRQVAPEVLDLTSTATRVSPLIIEVPTGAWGDETRDFHVPVKVPPAPVGNERLAARAEVVVDDQVVAKGLVRAVWTDDANLTTRIDPAVAHYTGQARLGEVIQEGLAARAGGRDDEATTVARRGGQAGQGVRQRGHDAPAGEGGRRRRRRRPERFACARTSPRPTRWRSTPARRRRRASAGSRHRDGDAARTATSPPTRSGATRAAPGSAPRRRRHRRRRRATPAPTPAPAHDRARRHGRLPALRDAERRRRPVLRGLRLRLHDRPGTAGGTESSRRRRRRPATAAHRPAGSSSSRSIPAWYDLRGELSEQPCPPPTSST